MNVISLFSGIGAPEKALTNLGIKYHTLTCEWNVHSLISYANIHHKEAFEKALLTPELNEKYFEQKFKDFVFSNNGKDAAKTIPKETKIKLNAALTTIDNYSLDDYKGGRIGDIDLLIGGFPCQDISNAGKREGIIKGETRSGLMYDMLEIIEKQMPKVAIAENVKSLLNVKHKPQLEEYVATLENLGYNVTYGVLNATEFGIPQSRERVFIVATLKGTFNFDNLVKKETKPLKEFLGDFEFMTIEDAERVRNWNGQQRPFGKVHGDNSKEVGTITTREENSAASKIYSPNVETIENLETPKEIIGYNVRRLHESECLRLMGFTIEDYNAIKSEVAKSQIYKQAGNSIVVQVMEAILKEVHDKHI